MNKKVELDMMKEERVKTLRNVFYYGCQTTLKRLQNGSKTLRTIGGSFASIG